VGEFGVPRAPRIQGDRGDKSEGNGLRPHFLRQKRIRFAPRGRYPRQKRIRIASSDRYQWIKRIRFAPRGRYSWIKRIRFVSTRSLLQCKLHPLRA
jgi:hypothetical protein